MQDPEKDPQQSNHASAVGHLEQHTLDIERHSRKCAVCHHPDRAQIEDDYLHWRGPTEIASDYHLGHRCAVYRHAEATGLTARRRGNVFAVLDSIIEHSENVKPSANDVVRAVRLYAQMTGQWSEPQRTYVITHQDASGNSTTTTHVGRRPSISSSMPNGPANPNRDTPGLDNDPTH
jgi:hypothetical protein